MKTPFQGRRLMLAWGLAAIAVTARGGVAPATSPADLLLLNGRVYTFAWDEPGIDGTPASNAPRTNGVFHPDAEAVAIRGGKDRLRGNDARCRSSPRRGNKGPRPARRHGASGSCRLPHPRRRIGGGGKPGGSDGRQDGRGSGGAGRGARAQRAERTVDRRRRLGRRCLGQSLSRPASVERKGSRSPRLSGQPSWLRGLGQPPGPGASLHHRPNQIPRRRRDPERCERQPHGSFPQPRGAPDLCGAPRAHRRAVQVLHPGRAEDHGQGRLRRDSRSRCWGHAHAGVRSAGSRETASRARVRDALGPRRGVVPEVAGPRPRQDERPHAGHPGGEGLLRRGPRFAGRTAARGLFGPAGPPRGERWSVRLRPEARGGNDEGRLPGGHPRHRRCRQP